MVDFKLILVALGTALGGCVAPSPAGSEGSQTKIVVQGDWNDVPAAVEIGAARAEMAMLGQEEPRPGELIFRLRTVEDRPAVLRAVGQADAAAGPGPIELSAEVGRFGDVRVAGRLVRAVAERLEDLAGVDYRPLD